MRAAQIDIHCPLCAKRMPDLAFSESLADRALRCETCHATLKWRSCRRCQTGWVSSRDDEPCPGCPGEAKPPGPGRTASSATSNKPRGPLRALFCYACPHCGGNVAKYRVLVNPRTVTECHACGQFLELTGYVRGMAILLGVELTLATLAGDHSASYGSWVIFMLGWLAVAPLLVFKVMPYRR